MTEYNLNRKIKIIKYAFLSGMFVTFSIFKPGAAIIKKQLKPTLIAALRSSHQQRAVLSRRWGVMAAGSGAAAAAWLVE